jgi:monoamine oxidase
LKDVSLPSLKIGIAGAGIAGLVAGLELQNSGHRVSIFEARSRAGGRIESFDIDGMIAESGPEFIHGNGQQTIALLKKFGLEYESIEGKMYRMVKGRIQPDEEWTPGWDQMLKKMKEIQQDVPFGEFLEKNFPEGKYLALRKAATGFAEGFDLVDTATASTKALIAEWEHEFGGQYRIRKGYGKLIDCLRTEFQSAGGKIYFNQPVRQVLRLSDSIRLTIFENISFDIDKLVVCLPFSAFNQAAPVHESIEFIPALDEKYSLLHLMGFGNVIKIILSWDEPFWQSFAPDALFIFSECFIPTWWTQYPRPSPMLTGWLGGPKALSDAEKPNDFFLSKALESLSEIFNIPVKDLEKRLKGSSILNWKNIPWTRGAYTYAKVGYKEFKERWRKPVDGNIYFAGEAYYEGIHPGTVEASIVSARETAGRLLAEIQ